MSAATPATTVREERRPILRLLGAMVRERPLPVLTLLVFGIIANSRLGLFVASIGGITQALIDRDQDAALIWSGVFFGALLIENLYWPAQSYLQSVILDSAIHRLHGRVLRRAATAPLVAFEDGPFFARLQRATDDLGQRVTTIFQSVAGCAQVVVMVGSVLVPFWLINPWFVPILLVAFIPGFITQYRTARVEHDARVKHATGDQLLLRIGTILTDRDAAAELRLFGNGPDLIRRWRETRDHRGDDVLAAERQKTRAVLLGEIGVAIGAATTLVIIVWMLIEGQALIGAWVTVLVGLEFMLGMIYALAAELRSVREESLFLGDLFAFEDEADRLLAAGIGAASGGQRRESVASPLASEAPASAMRIVADRVSFAYPASDRRVVDDVSLSLAPGERVAIVGENGAGKTTLVRLLTGLYWPDAGTVTHDGIDTRSEAAMPLRRRIGAVFQDYVPWQMTARENIGLSDLARMADDDAIRLAADQAGVLDLIDTLPEGLETWLGREFGERDLSGGQWQRVALARAFFRDARFLVLDEPTAALDPLAEQRLFERFNLLAEGRTALTISHRLGPARFADRVILMEGGRIVEEGHHDALMARNGRYARMFRAQAAWYGTDAPGDRDG